MVNTPTTLASVRVGQRVKVAPHGTVGYERTGRISDLIFCRELFARVILECGGVLPTVGATLLSPAPSIPERLPQYREITAREALHRIVLARLGVALTFKETAHRMGVNVTTISNWNKAGKVSSDRLQQLADVLDVTAAQVRFLLERENAPIVGKDSSLTSYAGKSIYGRA